MSREDEKRLAAYAAVDCVSDGALLGLGTGSTAGYVLERLAERVRGGLRVQGVATSVATETLAKRLGVPLTTLEAHPQLLLTIDGADEFDPQLHLIKGAGGALYREKIVAAASERLWVVVDATKQVNCLGKVFLPVEINPFGWRVTQQQLSALGAQAHLRGTPQNPFCTENRGWILDCNFSRIPHPAELEAQLRAIPGVMATGLFVGMASEVFMGRGKEVQRFVAPAAKA